MRCRYWMIGVILLVGLAGRAAGYPEKGGERLYRTACSACHGIDDKGVPVDRVGFDLPLPDFTDCSFASREPDLDWNAITRKGGPARAFSQIMPAFGDAYSDEEIGMITAHVRTFCPDKNWPPGELNLPRLLVTEKAFPEDEAVFTSGITAEGPASISNRLIYEKRFGARNQIELVVPFGWSEQRAGDGAGLTEWHGGVGDIALAAKRALLHSGRTGSIVGVTGEVIFPTGDREKGFGKGTTIFEPFITYGQILPSDFFFQGQTGFEIPVDAGRASREGFWRFALGRTFFAGKGFGRAWSPMVEFLGARELVAGEKALWDIIPQMQVTLSRRQHIMANLGVRLPLNERGPRETQVLFYILWDWFDGGLFDGW